MITLNKSSDLIILEELGKINKFCEIATFKSFIDPKRL